MSGTIRIISSNTVVEDEKTKLSFLISTSRSDNSIICDEMWFTTDNKYGGGFSGGVCDGVVLMLLPYALRGGYDIESSLPITASLHYTLTHQLIPQILSVNKVHQTEIRAERIKTNYQPSAIATAMSCGVDSFYTFFQNAEESVPKDLRITHLTFFENGAHHSNKAGYAEVMEKNFEEQCQAAKAFCEEHGYELIVVRSNMNAFLHHHFWADDYNKTYSFRNAGFVLLLQKTICLYYHAPAYSLDKFSCNLNASGAHYESMLFSYASTDCTKIYNSDSTKTRCEKIKYLATKPETYHHLLVCFQEGHNCGWCVKCRRTLVELDMTGELELYEDCFQNVQDYKEHREKWRVWLMSNRHMDDVMMEDYEYMLSDSCVFQVPPRYHLLAIGRTIGRTLKKVLK